MENEIIVSKDELKDMFKNKQILDTGKGWFYDDKEIEIIAIHDIEVKYLNDMLKADFYKLKYK